MKDYYKILGVSPGCQAGEVKKAYHGLAKQYHPDTTANSTLPEDERQRLADKFKEVNEANIVLSHPARRNRYDRELKQDGHPFFTTPKKSEPPAEKKVNVTPVSSKPQAKPGKQETKTGVPSQPASGKAESFSHGNLKKRPADRFSSFSGQQTENSGKQVKRHRKTPPSTQHIRRDKREYPQEKKEDQPFYNNDSLSKKSAMLDESYRHYKIKKKMHSVIVALVVGFFFLLLLFILSGKNIKNSRREPIFDNLEYSQSLGEISKQQIMLEIFKSGSSGNVSQSSRPSSPKTDTPEKNRFSQKNVRAPLSKPQSASGKDGPADNSSLLDQIWDGANVN